jgi:hypothetical protein
MAPTTGAGGVAWTRGAGLVQRKIFGQLSAAQMRTLILAIGALGALSHATGVAFAFDVLPTTVAEWWPKALEALPQLSVAWGAHHILRQLLQLAWGAQLSYVRLSPAARTCTTRACATAGAGAARATAPTGTPTGCSARRATTRPQTTQGGLRFLK